MLRALQWLSNHDRRLGGVCTAWNRGPYTIDGCIQWLTGGAFDRIYQELAILPRVSRKTIERFLTYRDARDGCELHHLARSRGDGSFIHDLAPEDGDEIQRLVATAERFVTMPPPFDRPPELASIGEQLATFWSMRHELGTMAHFRKPIGVWSKEHLKSQRLRRVFSRMFPEEAPALLLLMVLGYLKHGYLSRPIGGTGRFRDALTDSYFRLGGEGLVHSTVDEILIEKDRACGVRLANGTIIESDLVVSTASAPETVLRLLGGRYRAAQTRERLDHHLPGVQAATRVSDVGTPLTFWHAARLLATRPSASEVARPEAQGVRAARKIRQLVAETPGKIAGTPIAALESYTRGGRHANRRLDDPPRAYLLCRRYFGASRPRNVGLRHGMPGRD